MKSTLRLKSKTKDNEVNMPGTQVTLPLVSMATVTSWGPGEGAERGVGRLVKLPSLEPPRALCTQVVGAHGTDPLGDHWSPEPVRSLRVCSWGLRCLFPRLPRLGRLLELLAQGTWLPKTRDQRWQAGFLLPLLSVGHGRKGCVRACSRLGCN